MRHISSFFDGTRPPFFCSIFLPFFFLLCLAFSSPASFFHSDQIRSALSANRWIHSIAGWLADRELAHARARVYARCAELLFRNICITKCFIAPMGKGRKIKPSSVPAHARSSQPCLSATLRAEMNWTVCIRPGLKPA